jgi:hypothetical protein
VGKEMAALKSSRNSIAVRGRPLRQLAPIANELSELAEHWRATKGLPFCRPGLLAPNFREAGDCARLRVYCCSFVASLNALCAHRSQHVMANSFWESSLS